MPEAPKLIMVTAEEREALQAMAKDAMQQCRDYLGHMGAHLKPEGQAFIRRRLAVTEAFLAKLK